MSNSGKFVISLDFELYWGVRDKMTLETYGKNILGVWEAIPRMLKLFKKHQVKSTFATVGFLFAANKRELLAYCPSIKPNYSNPEFSPYNGHFDLIEDSLSADYQKDKLHFAHEIINLLLKHPEQEIATHTFSHYYCLEQGQVIEDFKRDMEAAIQIASKNGIKLKSIVFPRNQFGQDNLEILKELGMQSYRGNQNTWFYKMARDQDENLFKRAFRLIDAYLNISGHHCYSLDEINRSKPFNIPASRFLRCYSPSLKSIDFIKMKRILNSMTFAAKHNKIFHLWWHPHNFGVHQEENFEMLSEILEHYKYLNKKHNFESATMGEIAELLNRQA